MSRRNTVLSLAAAMAVGAGAAAPALAHNLPFTVTELADFDIPWAMAFLPDGRLLVTEQRGTLKLYTPGGSTYDMYARFLMQYMGRHMPGNPTFIPRNMPGAGHIRATQHMYTQATKDGTHLGLVNNGIPMEQIVQGRWVARSADCRWASSRSSSSIPTTNSAWGWCSRS